ncbi:ATPase components of ABC transporters with duplicated ATPase domains [Gracilibacillus orientalis]|uniref:ATPase components of ABC transporters with duplicated ATPase domains n=1 Tax=Gracilibacillus orientalis TaxID=334253 RepID=A0A1I4Q4X0_9BACI|nr:ABC-F type ribosomal protection protein [Gracilibacillus orientalis]SFM34715.1 ATPase components of ABC transporters with duplicated ATPase domains [Gracilibacillus orientalis]
MIVCSTNKIAKMYGGNLIFEDISFEIKEKDRVGLVGPNGSGKSTLIRLLAGVETPDSGQIHWKKGAKIGYLEQIPNYHDQTTVRNVLKSAFSPLLQIEEKMKRLENEMSMETNADKLEKLIVDYGNLQDQFTIKGGYEIESQIEGIVHGLNIPLLLEQPFSQLSGGEKTKVGLGLMLLQRPDLLLLDEPTNHLDLMAVEWLGSFLQEYSGTVLIISHDRYFLDEVVNKVMDLEDGEITSYHTNFSGFFKEKEARLLREFQAYEEQQKKIKKMKEAIKRLKDWANRANPPNAGLHRRAKNMERALKRMEKLQLPTLNRKTMNLQMDGSDRSGNDVIMLKEVSKSFQEHLLFKDINMYVTYQERVAVIGENGTGKTTLIKLILQQLDPDKGEVRLGSNVKVGYLSQHIFFNMKDETVIETFRDAVKVSEGEARHILARFMFYGYAVFKKITQLSGGERMRLRLAQMMYQDFNLLILDEPTNHLDIESREVLEEALDDFQGTILAVSHDRYFLNKLFSKIYWIEAKKLYCFEGNYNWAKDKMAELRDKAVPERVEKKKKTPVQKEPSFISKRVGNKNLEKELALLEEHIIELDQKMLNMKDLALLQQLYQEKEDLEHKWEELCDQLEEE